MLFQVFQSTALVIRGPATRGENFIGSLDCVAINEEKLRGVLLCVQDFVRSPHFTQRSFCSESGLTMLTKSVAIADGITSSPIYNPWRSIVEKACTGQVIADLRACRDRVDLHRFTAKDNSERWHHGGIPRSETTSRPGCEIWMSLKRGASNMGQSLHLLLVLQGLAKFVLSLARRRENSLGAPRSCRGIFGFPVLQVVPGGDPW